MKRIINRGIETLFKGIKNMPIKFKLLAQHQNLRNQIVKNKY